MFNYSVLETTGTFYIEFESSLLSYLAEDLIRYWYKQWFRKDTNVLLTWINLNAYSVKDLVKVTICISDCSSKQYLTKNFINNTTINGDNRRSLRRVLIEGVNTSTCNLAGVTGDISIDTEPKLDIPDPYKKFTDCGDDVSYEKLTELVNRLITKEKDTISNLLREPNTNYRFTELTKELRKLLDKLDVLEEIKILSKAVL